jgi:heme oxygenase (biliverdin-IX-beta and delta-forming)
MHGFVAPMEAAFGDLPAELSTELEMNRRQKAGLIVGDLEALAPRLGHAPLDAPWCDALPARGTVPQALGALYVLEGSTLGSRWLVRHLTPLGIERCCAYLLSYGEDLGAMWNKLRAVLSSHSQRYPEQDAALVAAAQETFQSLDLWFVRCGAAEVSRAA